MTEYILTGAKILLVYYVASILLSVYVTILDKKRAKQGGKRISENKLFAIAIFGNALSMYFTMKQIKHKTRHVKFMYGLPITILIKLVLAAVAAIIIKIKFYP